ncbi:hypothetical protein OHB12_35730 [Nocardia sp. NBC_01730]|uniref:hypothetical protein n=1 Tax=Nocardia sp. NBC_01730 TaxID=2975998 RepID=UPI002E0FE6E5|nr:hypothetical protein OHB12_35730 [Nocardia sp. NBC_01730]
MIAESGAPQHVEAMIDDRVDAATRVLATAPLARDRIAALGQMALLCTARKS